ncbi:uncharacterized protein B0P05DRAFT_460786 [Gilbertella persicaria]|uniref:uncharacterized protein n=1 Tax=Gilbertella persicaria TaxID=101096 RepID=UPI00221EE393|nr:uncharacterized protein B0P05DRAFT_460786 [Gilbertella persicaria]KAI8098291.1 hypothetical protein B0P05DRAFT_460786 [Gilbertella persicaria]
MALLEIIQKLGAAREELDLCLTQAKIELKAIEYASNSPPNFDSASKDVRVDFEKPYPDEERMRRGLLYWQNTTQQNKEDRFESSDSEVSADEEMVDVTTNRQTEDTGGDPFWILDLNPDMQP